MPNVKFFYIIDNGMFEEFKVLAGNGKSGKFSLIADEDELRQKTPVSGVLPHPLPFYQV